MDCATGIQGIDAGSVYDHCLFFSNVDNNDAVNCVDGGAGIVANGGEYMFHGNVISGCNNAGIFCENIMVGDEPDRKKAIENNIIYDIAHWGIRVEDTWNGGIFNNIVYSNGEQEILLDNAATGAWVINNIVDDDDCTSSEPFG